MSSVRRITFTYNGENFSVGMEAYDEDLPIRLPDGRVLVCSGWFETFPPRPWSLKIKTTETFLVAHAVHVEN